MAKVLPQQKKNINKKKPKVLFDNMLEKENFIILLVGIIVIVLGYVLMASGGVEDAMALVIAPIVLIFGYCVIIPFGILYKKKSSSK